MAGLVARLAQIKAQPDVQAIEINYDAANPVSAYLSQAGFQPTEQRATVRLKQGYASTKLCKLTLKGERCGCRHRIPCGHGFAGSSWRRKT